jgi:hypothetical protein
MAWDFAQSKLEFAMLTQLPLWPLVLLSLVVARLRWARAGSIILKSGELPGQKKSLEACYVKVDLLVT